MVEAVSTAAPKQFTTVQYNTKDGETITATKKDGVVTLVGDKSGVRKMPIERQADRHNSAIGDCRPPVAEELQRA